MEKLKIVTDSIRRRLVEKPELSSDDLRVDLADRHGITIHRVSVWRFLRGLGVTHKNDLQGAPRLDHAASAFHAQLIATQRVNPLSAARFACACPLPDRHFMPEKGQRTTCHRTKALARQQR